MRVDEPLEGGHEPGVALPAEAGRIRDGAILSGETFSREAFRLASAKRAYFTDCLFRDCIFEGCNFQRCDFEAVVFEACTFVDCDFSSADLRSVEFARCSITNAKFPNGAIKACLFSKCELTRCRFYRQSFEENRLTDCLLENCRFHRATMLHVEFRRCAFRSSSIADCTSLYHIFEACSFTNTEINVDSVPLSFGLSRENLGSLRLVWQGKRLKRGSDVVDLLDDLLKSVAVRGWSLPAAVLALNFSLAPTRDAFDLVFAGIIEAAQARRPLRTDELKFLARIVNMLVARKHMPFLPVMKGLDVIIDLAEKEAHEEALRPLFHALRDAEQTILQSWEQTWRLLQPLSDRMVEVEFLFEEDPQVPLQPIAEELQHILGSGVGAPKLMGTRSGSYIEMLSIPVSTLLALTISMGMLVRILDLAIIVRIKYGILRAPQVPQTIYARALAEPQSASAELLQALRAIADGVKGGQAPLTSGGADVIAGQLRQITVLDDGAAGVPPP
jgi:hypothetical protein